MKFFCGMHSLAHAGKLPRVFVSANRLRGRKAPIPAREWIMDSGGFSELLNHGAYRESPEQFAENARRWASNGSGKLLAVVSQDFMCAPPVLEKTGGTVAGHQRLTIERYDTLLQLGVGTYLMPVLQGQSPSDFAEHVRAYGGRLAHGAWVAVGSIQPISKSPAAVGAVLLAIKAVRPDLRLHGLGLKGASLSDSLCHALLESADSMAWSFAARREGRNGNCASEAVKWVEKMDEAPRQALLFT